MNYAKTVELGVARFLFNYGVDYLIPSGEAVSMLHGIRDYSMLCCPVVNARLFGLGIFFGM